MAPPSAVAYKGVNHAGPIACCHRRLLSGPKVAASGAVPVFVCPDIAAAFALQGVPLDRTHGRHHMPWLHAAGREQPRTVKRGPRYADFSAYDMTKM